MSGRISKEKIIVSLLAFTLLLSGSGLSAGLFAPCRLAFTERTACCPLALHAAPGRVAEITCCSSVAERDQGGQELYLVVSRSRLEEAPHRDLLPIAIWLQEATGSTFFSPSCEKGTGQPAVAQPSLFVLHSSFLL